MKMQNFALILQIITLCTAEFVIRQNVVFQKVKEITVTADHWRVTLVDDLRSFEQEFRQINAGYGQVHALFEIFNR